jgi:Tfp pilus assembly protein PilF
VGQFYLTREDYKGAYIRFKEATQVDPENADAVFYLAETARRMNHRDEAAQNYQLYLDALPDGPKAKEARRALRDLSASAKH